MKDLQVMIEEEQRGRDDARDAAARAERKASELGSELEDLRNQLEQVKHSSHTQNHANKNDGFVISEILIMPSLIAGRPCTPRC